jgi:hypothetical protein
MIWVYAQRVITLCEEKKMYDSQEYLDHKENASDSRKNAAHASDVASVLS